MDILAHLKELTAAPGISGYEMGARETIRAAWEPLADEVSVDRLGSLWATKAGSGPKNRPKIMLAGHMDTIGLMVNKVEGEFLRVTGIGGIDARVMPGQLVTVHGRQDLPGVVVRPPAFLLPKGDRDGILPLQHLLVDVGEPAESLAKLVQVGDVITFAEPPRELQNGTLAARGLDNRASVAALTVCLETLQGRQHVWDVVLVATVQEEVGVRGALTAAFELNPALAVAIDVTFGSGPGTKDFADRTFALGDGPVLALGPNIHPGLHAAFKTTAEQAEIPYSIEALAMHSGTDAFAIQVARAGIPTMVVSLPLRNMHTPVEVLSVIDVTRAGRLLAEFIAGLSADYVSTLTLE